MKPQFNLLLSFLLFGTFLASCDNGRSSSENSSVTFENAFVILPPPSRRIAMGGFSATVNNKDVYLVDFRTNHAKSVELHDMTMANGIMKMRKLNRLKIEKDETIQLQRGGKHLMFFELDPKLKPSDNIVLLVTVEERSGNTKIYEVEAKLLEQGVK